MDFSKDCKVGVIGAGAWGTVLAAHCQKKGHQTCIWALEKEVVESINGEGLNHKFLPDKKLPEGLKATGDMKELFEFADLILMVVPTPFVERTLAPVKGLLRPTQILVSCSKGIHMETLETLNEILLRIFPTEQHHQLAYLSGPSFAAEVYEGYPTAVTIACQDASTAENVQKCLSTKRFRCYRTSDVVGVELGGALKNVLAIACGISDGLNFGNNGRAALITRGLNEITRLAVAKGANPLTMNGLAGLGDLVLTCTGELSRNRTVGLRIGRGEKLKDIQASTNSVAEGVLTSQSAYMLAKKLGVECPIIAGIYQVIHENADPVEIVHDVMGRDLREEVDPVIQDALKQQISPK